MKVSESRRDHLTYCTNIHPGESWPEVRANLQHFVPEVKQRVGCAAAFGVGLRLSSLAAEQLEQPAALEELRDLLRVHGLYVFTLNGFPYGPFHGKPVKEQVYSPDWLDDARLLYTDRLAVLLAEILPEGLSGSLSTVPGCFRPLAHTPGARDAIGRRMLRHVHRLWQLAETSGRHISLALEPEPSCLLETTQEGVEFIQAHLLSERALEFFAQLSGLSGERAEIAVRAHVGLCLDACHSAVEFEDPARAVASLRAAGIQVAKAQLSCGLQVTNPSASRREALRAFDDSVYLHQTVIRRRPSREASADLIRLLDLPDALARPLDANAAECWRIHFHVPIFLRKLGLFESTQNHLERLLEIQRTDPFTEHLEVETYTWDVLPAELRLPSVSESIAREISWVRQRLGA